MYWTFSLPNAGIYQTKMNPKKYQLINLIKCIIFTLILIFQYLIVHFLIISRTTMNLSSLDALQRIFSLEQEKYKLNDQLIASKNKIENKNAEIMTLRATIVDLKKQLEQKHRESSNYSNGKSSLTVCQHFVFVYDSITHTLFLLFWILCRFRFCFSLFYN